jgi:hypothetical protein
VFADCATLVSIVKTELNAIWKNVFEAVNAIRTVVSIQHYCEEVDAGRTIRGRRQTPPAGFVVTSEVGYESQPGTTAAAVVKAVNDPTLSIGTIVGTASVEEVNVAALVSSVALGSALTTTSITTSSITTSSTSTSPVTASTSTTRYNKDNYELVKIGNAACRDAAGLSVESIAKFNERFLHKCQRACIRNEQCSGVEWFSYYFTQPNNPASKKNNCVLLGPTVMTTAAYRGSQREYRCHKKIAKAV